MKSALSLLVILLLTCNTSPLFSQSSQVGIIDSYGHGFTKSSLQSCLPFRENDTIKFIEDDLAFTNAKSSMEKCLLKLPSVRQAEVTFVCCSQPGDHWIVYAGMDTAAPAAPAKNKTADIRLPEAITGKYDRLMELLMEAVEKNEAGEDNSKGHTLMQYAPARKIQEEFVPYADANLKLLSSVLRTSRYPEEREVAATVIGYHSNKTAIVGDLLYAVNDPNDGVRNNAMRAISSIAEYSQKNPGSGIQISADPFISLINSISWTDRNKSSMVLLSLTRTRDQKILEALKSKALKSITDMAGWQNFGHSLPGYILLGRIAGWSEQVIMSAVNNERAAQIEEMLKSMK